MIFTKTLLLYSFFILSITSLPALATVYTRFQDLPKCGQECIHGATEWALVKANCAASLACACASDRYLEWMYSCLDDNEGCKDAAVKDAVLDFNQDYWCNPKSDGRASYTIEVQGAKKTLTLEAKDTSTIMSSELSDTATASSKSSSLTSSHSSSTNTSHSSIKQSSSSKQPSMSEYVTLTKISPSSITSAPSNATSTTTSSSQPSITIMLTTSATPIGPGPVGPGFTVVDANTTIQGHTYTVKSTTSITVTVTAINGSGLCHLERIRHVFEDHSTFAIGFCVAWAVSLVFPIFL